MRRPQRGRKIDDQVLVVGEVFVIVISIRHDGDYVNISIGDHEASIVERAHVVPGRIDLVAGLRQNTTALAQCRAQKRQFSLLQHVGEPRRVALALGHVCADVQPHLRQVARRVIGIPFALPSGGVHVGRSAPSLEIVLIEAFAQQPVTGVVGMHDGVGHDGLQVVAIYIVRRHDSGTVEDDVFDHLFIKRGSAAVHHILRRESHERCLDRAGREEPLIGVVPHTLVRGQVVHDKAHLVTRIVVCRDGAFHIGDLVGGQGARDAGHRIEQVHVFGARCGVERCARIFGDGARVDDIPGLRLRGRSLSRLRSRFGERGNHLVGHGDGILGSHGARSHRARADGQHRHGTHDHARHEGRPMLQPMLDRFENPCHNSLSDDFASPLRASGSFRLCSIP